MRVLKELAITAGAVLAIAWAYGLLRYGTLDPCGMAAVEMKRATVQRMQVEAGVLAGLYLDDTIDRMTELAAPWRCVNIVIMAHRGKLEERIWQ